MVNNIVFVIAFILLVCNNVGRVGSADECKTNADCKSTLFPGRHCCGGLYLFGNEDSKKRSCTFSSCLDHYCSKDSDCDDPSMCCRSNQCVNKGCLGCVNNADCYDSHVCCKKTFVFNQTLCADNCISQDCNWNDDCAGTNECCRSGKCTKTGCRNKCESNSDCDFGQYCCRKKKGTVWRRRNAACAKSCVGEICSTGEDCGHPNECCISNKCVTSGCSGCTTNSNCSSGHYCCKKRQWYELSECSADCIGKSCSTTEDCGGPGETCGSDNRCAIDRRKIGCTTNLNCSSGHYCCKKRLWYELSECSADCIGKSCSATEDCGGPGETCDTSNRCTTEQSKTGCSLPPWLIPVITVCNVAFFVAVGIILTVFWIRKRRAATNTTRAGAVGLQNTRYDGAGFENPLLNPPSSDLNNTGQATAFHNQSLASRGAQTAQSQVQAYQNAAMVPQQRNENHEFYYNHPQNNDNQVHRQFNNPLNNPVYHTLESPYLPRDAQYNEYQGNVGNQMYPLNTPYQGTINTHNPPYNPHYHDNH